LLTLNKSIFFHAVFPPKNKYLNLALELHSIQQARIIMEKH
jgi:hypothetical protein